MENGLSPEEACRLIGEDLGIDRSRVRPCLEGNGSRISCLVGVQYRNVTSEWRSSHLGCLICT